VRSSDAYEERGFRQSNNLAELKENLKSQGDFLREQGDWAGSMQFLLEAEKICRELGDSDRLQGFLITRASHLKWMVILRAQLGNFKSRNISVANCRIGMVYVGAARGVHCKIPLVELVPRRFPLRRGRRQGRIPLVTQIHSGIRTTRRSPFFASQRIQSRSKPRRRSSPIGVGSDDVISNRRRT